jgi:hypothetical protein
MESEVDDGGKSGVVVVDTRVMRQRNESVNLPVESVDFLWQMLNESEECWLKRLLRI